jgi:spoIIIJ-associated protein
MLDCSISDLQSEVIQHPSKGLFGFLKKNAIIVATCSKLASKNQEKKETADLRTMEESVASEIIATVKEEQVTQSEVLETILEKDAIVDRFFEVDHDDEAEDVAAIQEETIVYDELALMIEDQLKELLSHSCFDIDVVEVDVRDNTALIFIDGNDAALLIGKEGYRYNALSYMLFNWLHAKYELFIKLEIAEFLTTQQEMIRNYIKPVIENVEKQGKGKTRFLDGILVQIALEQLRERFPDKYVAVKTGREGKKFVAINEFNNNKSNA